jgi:hypothetical protein
MSLSSPGESSPSWSQLLFDPPLPLEPLLFEPVIMLPESSSSSSPLSPLQRHHRRIIVEVLVWGPGIHLIVSLIVSLLLSEILRLRKVLLLILLLREILLLILLLQEILYLILLVGKFYLLS